MTIENDVRAAAEAVSRIPPVDLAIHHLEQRRSVARGLRPETTTEADYEAALALRPEFVVLDEVKRQRDFISALCAELGCKPDKDGALEHIRASDRESRAAIRDRDEFKRQRDEAVARAKAVEQEAKSKIWAAELNAKGIRKMYDQRLAALPPSNPSNSSNGSVDPRALAMEIATSLITREQIHSIHRDLVSNLVEQILRKALPARDAEWQPIETAPQDGTWILAINNRRNQSVIIWTDAGIGLDRKLYPGWIHPFSTMELSPFWNGSCGSVPTHWMPLSEPPFDDTPAPSAEPSWIEWNGGECPVDREAVVEVKYRNGNVEPPVEADLYRWNHDDEDEDVRTDIIAYRVVAPKDEEA